MAGKESPIVNDNTDKNCDGEMNDVGKTDVAGNGNMGSDDAGMAVKNPYGPWLMVSYGTNHINTDALQTTNAYPKPLETVDHGNVEVIEQLHIEAIDINALPAEESNQRDSNKSDLHLDSTFDVVASELQEVMAGISE
ncbi:hypothetical protein Q3G72_026040 [Acer saccharum]|nr:hypothetical protein Q3G72_026040 [Acer saccharum]